MHTLGCCYFLRYRFRSNIRTIWTIVVEAYSRDCPADINSSFRINLKAIESFRSPLRHFLAERGIATRSISFLVSARHCYTYVSSYNIYIKWNQQLSKISSDPLNDPPWALCRGDQISHFQLLYHSWTFQAGVQCHTLSSDMPDKLTPLLHAP